MQFCSLRLKSSFLAAAALALAAASLAQTGAIPATAIPITVDAHAPAHDFPHFWEKMFGSGHASLAMREGYRDDLKAVHDQVGMRYVRFHAILLDDVGVYNEDENGNAVYNFTYVDQIYDGLLARGVRPMVEISFMPYALASKNSIQGFWYKPNVSPPKDYGKWDALIRAFAQHLIDRYGIDEVAQWYFEVWNEPNIDFWAGVPKQATYFELYDHTARALKQVSPRLRVGGPATAAAHWIPDFLNYVSANHVPIDFVSTHAYADDTVQDLFGTKEDIPMRDRVCRAVQMVHGQIQASPEPNLPLFWTEWSVPSYAELQARDNWYVGPALGHDISQCDGNVNMMSWWTFDDVFEEGGVAPEPFVGMFGLIAEGNIKKPSFYAFSLLHKLGEMRLANSSDRLLVTRRADGTLVVAAWNLVDMDKVAEGKPITLRLTFKGVAAGSKVSIERLDESHGNPLIAYGKMGSPRYPTQAQVAALNKASALPPPEHKALTGDRLDVTLPVNGLAIVEIPAH
ncbi:MAG: glycosyl hydrolase family 39 [Terracidiphilus sp.]|jgi:xylan 1,4-beta-xylosidase